MDQGQAPYSLRKRKSPRRSQPGGLDTEDSLTSRNRPNYLEPWIVTLLLEYKESVTRTDGQLGHVLKVLNEPKIQQDAKQGPETILYIGDGHHYIEVVVAAKAESSIAQSGFSGIIGQFIILQNYRVCFKAATKMEDCQFYLTLECFRVMPMKRQEKRLWDCNQEPSVLQKIKELWQKSFVLQPWFSSESPSVSQVLKEINQDQLSTLKQSAKDCLNLLDPGKMLDSEQLAVYPNTKWQLERKQDKIHQDIFTVPAKFLVISAENEAALSRSYASKTPQAVPETDENIQDDDRSTISFFSADSASLDGSLENPWDAFPGITLSSSSDTSGTSPGLPQTQQMLLASPAEEANTHSSACASDFLEPCDNLSHCSSEQAAPVRPPTLLHPQDSEFPKGAANWESGLIAPTTAGQASEIADSVPCGQPLNKSRLHNSVHLYSPVHHSTEGDFSSEAVSENRKDCLSHAQRAKRMTARWKCLEKYVSAKRKQVLDEEEPSETFSGPTCSSNLEAVGQCSTGTVKKSSNPNKKHLHRYPTMKFVSTPKKRRFKAIQIQQSCVCPQCSCAERLLEKGSEQEPTGMVTRKSKQIGVQQKECVKGDRFHFIHNPPTPELCSQVQSVRISRALLGWARWVFSNMQKQ